MDHNPLEKEVKFYISDQPALKDRLLSLGAVMVQPRTRETNYRFDTPDGALSMSGRALRLRHDLRDILTFKGPSSTVDGVRVRPEYEVEVDNLGNAWLILQGLGYELVVSYEKWRAVYRLNDLVSPSMNCLMEILPRSKAMTRLSSAPLPRSSRWIGKRASKQATLSCSKY